MVFPKLTAKTAFIGNAIYCNVELRASGAQFTQEHADAINEVDKNYDAFCTLILAELARWPLTKQYFEHLVVARLRQNAILASEFIASLIGNTNPLEERLARIHNRVENLAIITSEVGLSDNLSNGDESDEIFLDLWNEIFVIDVLLNHSRLGFSSIEKVVRPKGQPQVDLIAAFSGIRYAIEVTRIRKRDFQGSTLPEMFEAVYQEKNLNKLRSALRNKLNSKNKQMGKFCDIETDQYQKKLLVIKTSQWEYQDGSSVVRDETNALMRANDYLHIDEVILIYDVENFDWLK